jgi:hypothetical protein
MSIREVTCSLGYAIPNWKNRASLETVVGSCSLSALYGKFSIGSRYTESSSIMATGGSSLSKSEISCTSSTCGLPVGDADDDGVSIGGTVDSASLSDSTLIRVPASSVPCTILDGVEGDGGEEGIASRDRLVRRFMVTRLEVGSGGGCSEGSRVGVEGGGLDSPDSALGFGSRSNIESGTTSVSRPVSTDLLREPPRETRCRFRETCSVTSSKGFGRPEQGSEEIARSRGASSIWQIRKATASGKNVSGDGSAAEELEAAQEGWHKVRDPMRLTGLGDRVGEALGGVCGV